MQSLWRFVCWLSKIAVACPTPPAWELCVSRPFTRGQATCLSPFIQLYIIIMHTALAMSHQVRLCKYWVQILCNFRKQPSARAPGLHFCWLCQYCWWLCCVSSPPLWKQVTLRCVLYDCMVLHGCVVCVAIILTSNVIAIQYKITLRRVCVYVCVS